MQVETALMACEAQRGHRETTRMLHHTCEACFITIQTQTMVAWGRAPPVLAWLPRLPIHQEMPGGALGCCDDQRALAGRPAEGNPRSHWSCRAAPARVPLP